MLKWGLIILLLLVLIFISSSKEGLMNIDKYKHYRLSDMVKGYIYYKENELYNKKKLEDKDTIAGRYTVETEHLPENLRWNNVEVLDKLTRCNIKSKATIHLRLGDVIIGYDRHKNKFVQHPWLTWERYFYQIEEYIPIINFLKQKNIDKVVIFYGNHIKWDDISDLYLEKFKELFDKNNITVIDKSSGNPDKDFTNMANSKIFVRSGGGFSRLIGKLVEYKGGTVIIPEQLNKN